MMKTTVGLIGVYPVQSSQPAHLVEVSIKDLEGNFDISEFTQEVANAPREFWQAPWDEKLLDTIGENIIADNLLTKESGPWPGNFRMIFFFHYLDFSEPLITPFGSIDIPEEKPMPERLIHIKYISPD